MDGPATRNARRLANEAAAADKRYAELAAEEAARIETLRAELAELKAAEDAILAQERARRFRLMRIEDIQAEIARTERSLANDREVLSKRHEDAAGARWEAVHEEGADPATFAQS